MTRDNEVRIIVNESGILCALMPSGEARKILVDVHGAPNYGFLTIEEAQD